MAYGRHIRYNRSWNIRRATRTRGHKMNRRKTTAIVIAIFMLATLLPSGALAAQFTSSSDPSAVPAEGGSVTLSVTIYNDGQYPMENIVIKNNGSALFTGTTGAVIAAGQSVTFQQTVTVPAALVGQPINFDVTWTENGEAKSGSFSVIVLNSGGSEASMLTATRTASSPQASQGETITLTYTLVNNGVTPISGVSITDKEIAGKEPMVKDVVVQPGVPYVFTYTYTMGRSTVTSSPVITFLQADGTTGTITVEDKTLGMVKSKISVEVQPGTPTAEGQTFKLILTNNGNQKISKIKITDELGNAVTTDAFALAIGESTSCSYTVPTDGERNVVFYINGMDATGTAYSDHTETYTVRKYIDPSLIGISFRAEVSEPLDSSGSISINFYVENSGSLEMKNLTLSEGEYGVLYQLGSVPQGTQTINQRMSVGTPRDLSFTLTIEDPSGNQYTYNAYITAGYVGVEPEATPTPDVEIQGGGLVSEVGGSISSALRTVLIVLVVLTVIAGAALVMLTSLEKEERRRMARRKAMRERQMHAQLEGGDIGNLPGGTPYAPARTDGATKRIPRQ